LNVVLNLFECEFSKALTLIKIIEYFTQMEHVFGPRYEKAFNILILKYIGPIFPTIAILTRFKH